MGESLTESRVEVFKDTTHYVKQRLEKELDNEITVAVSPGSTFFITISGETSVGRAFFYHPQTKFEGMWRKSSLLLLAGS